MHLLADLYGIEGERLADVERLAECLRAAARRCRLTELAPPVMHRFEGGGVTGLILLAESHIALHTYPEYGYVAVDIFSCGVEDPGSALAVFREALSPDREEVTTAVRGREVG
jgi:S-adenosylmethionine decarboxylase